MRFLLIVAAAVAIVAPATAQQAISPRVVTSLDAGWRFHRGDAPAAPAPDFDDGRWAQVTLPHTFNGADGDDGGGFYRGPGWYRRALILTAVPKGRVFLQFDGAALVTTAIINGQTVGSHSGGHARFRFDMTDALKAGRNQIAVRVDNTKVAEIPPLGGDFTLFGGLYRSVSLIETGTRHIDLLDHGSPGVRVTTRTLTDAEARVDVAVAVRNDGAKSGRLSVWIRIEDADGRTVAFANRALTVAAGASTTPTIPLVVARPRRWNGRADPYLYRIVAEVRDAAGSAVDEAAVPLGLRTARFDAARGFLLNDKPYPLHGVNLFHSGRPGRGLAVTDDEIADDMATLDDLGVTAVRFVHFQHPERAYAEADRRGFVVWTEIGLNGVVDPGSGFAANASQQMRELIRQNANHPSVALWGLGNEVYATTPEVTRTLQMLQGVVKAEDASRPTIYAHCCQADDIEKAKVSDVIAFNRYFGWYSEQKGLIGDWADGFHARYPDKPFVVGEYGAGASIRHQQLPPPEKIVTTSGWHPEQTQAAYHELNGAQLAAKPYLGGSFVWVAFDLASDGRGEGDRPGINDKGLISYDRHYRKDAFYWYQANWSPKPMVHIADGRVDQRTEPRVEVKVYSNAPQAALTVNGRAVGPAQVRGHIARWQGVALTPGVNRVTVTAGTASDSVEWTLGRASPIGASAVPEVVAPKPRVEPVKAPPGQ